MYNILLRKIEINQQNFFTGFTADILKKNKELKSQRSKWFYSSAIYKPNGRRDKFDFETTPIRLVWSGNRFDDFLDRGHFGYVQTEQEDSLLTGLVLRTEEITVTSPSIMQESK